MAKPWARIELGRLRHPKFLALTGNAIALWDEGKEFCDEAQTEGHIPLEALKTFRFRAQRSVALLTTSIGRRVGGDIYAPLWEPVTGGYQMHDYLTYNDCRTVVTARLEQAEVEAVARRDRDREYKRVGRAAKKAKREAVSVGQSVGQASGHQGGCPSDIRRMSPSITQPETETEETRKREKSGSLSPPADPYTDPATTTRAGAFVRRYEALYPKHRKGARYAVHPVRDYAAAVTLCRTWPDDARLDKLAVIFLTTDHKFAEEGSRTIPQFLGIASWCDGKLAEHEAKRSAP